MIEAYGRAVSPQGMNMQRSHSSGRGGGEETDSGGKTGRDVQGSADLSHEKTIGIKT